MGVVRSPGIRAKYLINDE